MTEGGLLWGVLLSSEWPVLCSILDFPSLPEVSTVDGFSSLSA